MSKKNRKSQQDKDFRSHLLIDKYLERLKNNEIAFISDKVCDDKKQVLIDRIQELRKVIEDEGYPDRETKQVDIAKEIWGILTVHAFRQISIAKSVRGFSDLNSYFLKSVESEDMLFGLDPAYRDHTMHALWVYLLGDYILHEISYLKDVEFDWGIVYDCHNNKVSKIVKRIKENLSRYLDAVLCIISLCHDLAYPFEKADRINQKIEDLSKFMGLQSFERLQYGFSLEQSPLLGKLFELISLKTVVTDGSIEFIRDDPTFVDMSHSFEQRKHGILSAYLLYRLIDTMGEITFTEINERPDLHRDVKEHLIIRRTILYAISSHTCAYAFSVAYNNFRFLLCLFDELEEFSRYTRKGRQGVNEICKSRLECNEDGVFEVNYIFTKDHIVDPMRFFFSRAKRFCRMVETDASAPEHRIKRIEMCCKDKKTTTDRCYRLKIDDKDIACMVSGLGNKWYQLTPDPDSKLQKLQKKLEDKKKPKKRNEKG